MDAGSATPLTASAVRDSEGGDLIVKIVNGGDEPAGINIRMAGLAGNVTMKATRTVLTGPNADAVNEDGQAARIKPQVSTESVRAGFTYVAPANSLTVYRIDR